MGISRQTLDFLGECIATTVGTLPNKRMLELGNQRISGSYPAKDYFASKGVEHVSVDLNGLDGALKLDLSKPEQFLKWSNYFDIVTNFGTSEHIEPHQAQYECFETIHNCLTVGGVALHHVPDKDELISKGYWKGHCHNFYSLGFFGMLVEHNKYKLVKTSTFGKLLAVCLQKVESVPFMADKEEFLSHIYRK